MIQKIISAVCALVLGVCSIGNVCFAEQESDKFTYTVDSKFNDVKTSDWFYEAVSKCEDLGIVGGYGDGNFGPNDPVTLNQVCLMSLRTYCQFVTGNAEFPEWTYSNDNDAVWPAFYRCTVIKALPSKYSSGEDNGRLMGDGRGIIPPTPDEPAWREEALSCFYRVMNYKEKVNIPEALLAFQKKKNPSFTNLENVNIPDVNDIDERYRNDIIEAYKSHFAEGYDSTGSFKPKNEITRAEFCQMMLNSGIIEMLHFRANG